MSFSYCSFYANKTTDKVARGTSKPRRKLLDIKTNAESAAEFVNSAFPPSI